MSCGTYRTVKCKNEFPEFLFSDHVSFYVQYSTVGRECFDVKLIRKRDGPRVFKRNQMDFFNGATVLPRFWPRGGTLKFSLAVAVADGETRWRWRSYII